MYSTLSFSREYYSKVTTYMVPVAANEQLRRGRRRATILLAAPYNTGNKTRSSVAAAQGAAYI